MDEVNSFIVILVLACGVLSLLLLSLLVVYRMCIFLVCFFFTCEDRGFGPHRHPQTQNQGAERPGMSPRGYSLTHAPVHGSA